MKKREKLLRGREGSGKSRGRKARIRR